MPFQSLDRLQNGTLYILAGASGAGKSHLAAAARPSGTIWLLDTECAADALIGKPGIHAQIQVEQPLSLQALLAAIRQVKTTGKPGDWLVIDSISRVYQALRARAQQRAGANDDRKTSLAYDEHGSINRNMQGIYADLADVRHAGMHVILIAHLTTKYRATGGALQATGDGMVADEKMLYEAHAALLVEMINGKRTVTPFGKNPRPAHMSVGKAMPATLASLYPHLAKKQPSRDAVLRRINALFAEANTSNLPLDADLLSADLDAMSVDELIGFGKTLDQAIDALVNGTEAA
jgi:hypothetical protein